MLISGLNGASDLLEKGYEITLPCHSTLSSFYCSYMAPFTHKTLLTHTVPESCVYVTESRVCTLVWVLCPLRKPSCHRGDFVIFHCLEWKRAALPAHSLYKKSHACKHAFTVRRPEVESNGFVLGPLVFFVPIISGWCHLYPRDRMLVSNVHSNRTHICSAKQYDWEVTA